MIRLKILVYAAGMLIVAGTSLAENSRAEEIIACVAARVRDSVADDRQYGYNQRVEITKFSADGAEKSREAKLFRTIWINDRAFPQLVQKDGRDLTPIERAGEITRQIEFSRNSSLKKSALQNELKKISWYELHERYDFEILQSFPAGGHLISFRPKSGNLPARTRTERVLNRLSGKIWTDAGCNVSKAEARLTQPVHFGLGLFAKIHEVVVKYSQQQIEDMWLPSGLDVYFSANFAMVRKERQRVQVQWFDPFLRQTAEARRPEDLTARR